MRFRSFSSTFVTLLIFLYFLPSEDVSARCLGSINEARKSCAKAAKVQGQIEQDANERMAQLSRLPANDHAALCKFGRTIVKAGFENDLKLLQNSPPCPDIPDLCGPGTEIKTGIATTRRLMREYKIVVDADCAKVANSQNVEKIRLADNWITAGKAAAKYMTMADLTVAYTDFMKAARLYEEAGATKKKSNAEKLAAEIQRLLDTGAYRKRKNDKKSRLLHQA